MDPRQPTNHELREMFEETEFGREFLRWLEKLAKAKNVRDIRMVPARYWRASVQDIIDSEEAA